jgi:quercetin dioxygenase-like cupin family protein
VGFSHSLDPKETITNGCIGLYDDVREFHQRQGHSAMTEKLSAAVNSYSIHEDQLIWFDVPLVKGGKAAVLHGDPTKAGTVVLRFKFPPNRQTPPHRHPYAEYTTILSGNVYYGEGEAFDASNPQIGKVGTFAVVPAGQAHFVWTLDEEAIVQLQFEGPSGTIFVNAADDQQRK